MNMVNSELLLDASTIIGIAMICMFVLLMARASGQAALFIRSRVSTPDRIMRMASLPLLLLLVAGPQHVKLITGFILILGALISIRLQHLRLLADGLQPGFVHRITALSLLGSVGFSAFVGAMVGRS